MRKGLDNEERNYGSNYTGSKKHVGENKKDLEIAARQDNDLEREEDEKSFKRRKRQGLYN